MSLFNSNWVIMEPLHGKQRMAIIVLFESAGMRVHDKVRNNEENYDSKDYPYLGNTGTTRWDVAGWKVKKHSNEIKYEEAKEELIRIIKNK